MVDIANFFKKTNKADSSQAFNQVRINIASPEQIRSWSYGEVTKPETINYRTFKPEKDGLFCAKIFGPVKDYECLCGKYKRMKYRGIVCEKCGVEVTTSKVRRERMGHIELASPIAHIWFVRSLPSRISILLDMNLKDLERVIYFEAYIVMDPGLSPLHKGDLLTEEMLQQAQNEYGEDNFIVGIGAEAIRTLLAELDLKSLRNALQEEVNNVINSDFKRKKILRRLKLIEDFIGSGNKPEWMIVTVLPIIPPELRPLVMLDAGRFASSDLNELYRRLINRNNRLKYLKKEEDGVPGIVLRNEQRMVQLSADTLFDNGKRGKAVKNSNKRPFKSLSDMLKGKQGRFRQNLLGKRVDYSGRSVIVVGPELKLHQCGLPKQMALELFKPFVYAELERCGIATTIKAAKRIVELGTPDVWNALAKVIKHHPVLLNRAPTLHCLSIQAFEPVLIEDKAIQLHPLVCTAFNADFDGDQMAVHVPLSTEAQLEARVLMMSTNNILSPANGRPIIVPDKDIVLGLYYLTLSIDGEDGEGRLFGSMAEIHHALFNKVVSLHSKIKFRKYIINADGDKVMALVNTTPGRLILGELLPDSDSISFDVVNKVMTKKGISAIVDMVYRYYGQKATVVFADKLMKLGFKYACMSGISFGMDDMIVPETKSKHVNDTLLEVQEFERQYSEGLITSGEKYNKVIDAWSRYTDRVANDMMKGIAAGDQTSVGLTNQERLNSIFMMADSEARSSVTQIKQLIGSKGLIAKASGEIIDRPILSNFCEGLTVFECFIGIPGTRKGLADTAVKTKVSGHLSRKLSESAHGYFVKREDCGTTNGLIITAVVEGGVIVVTLAEQVLGRVAVSNVYCPVTKVLILQQGEMIDEYRVELINTAGINSIKVRSVLTCELQEGVCAKCYGRDLSTGKLVAIGTAVGIVAAQSIGEPGTQLTMRTFHIGGAATRGVEASSFEAIVDGRVKIINPNFVVNSNNKSVIMSRSCEVILADNVGQEITRYKAQYGSILLVTDGQEVTKGTALVVWDPYAMPIVTEKSGYVMFKDMIDGVSVKDIIDESTGIVNRVIIEPKQGRGEVVLRPRICLLDQNKQPLTLSNGLEAEYFLPVNSILSVEEGVNVSAGDILARIPREFAGTKDITGGLPRVIELFEARKPKNHAVIAEIDGCVKFGKDYKSKRRLILQPNDESHEPIEYILPKGRHVTVNEGDVVKKGDMLIEGSPVLQDILKVMGVEALGLYIINEIQAVYRLQGVKIDNKHIEVIITRMLQKVEITDSGDSNFVIEEKVNKREVINTNKKLKAKGLREAQYRPILQGITKASLQTQSFISAASFQETTRVLTEAAIAGKVDKLEGLKENVIVGQTIPAGTGFYINEIKKIARQRDKEIIAAREEELQENNTEA